MQTIAEIYAARLDMLVKRYGQSKLAELINTHAVLIRVLITALNAGDEDNGDGIHAEQWSAAFRAVRQIENLLGLERGWFDQPLKDGEIIDFPNFPEIQITNTPSNNDSFQVRILNIEEYISGKASDINRNSVRMIDIYKQWAAIELGINHHDIAIVTVHGDNMYPTLQQNDLLFIDTSITSFENDGVYLLYEPNNNNIRVRRLQLIGNEILILTDNEKYQNSTVKVTDKEQLRIVGKVKRVFSLRRF